jgi:hypothetical protein
MDVWEGRSRHDRTEDHVVLVEEITPLPAQPVAGHRRVIQSRWLRIVPGTHHTYPPSIEKPHGLIMKVAYYFTRRQFGKVLTPLKVHSARLPPAFGLFYSKIATLL